MSVNNRNAVNVYNLVNDGILVATPEVEAIIALDAQQSYRYAIHIKRGRFIAGENAINNSIEYSQKYYSLYEKAIMPCNIL
jgi:hypothetical protein